MEGKCLFLLLLVATLTVANSLGSLEEEQEEDLPIEGLGGDVAPVESDEELESRLGGADLRDPSGDESEEEVEEVVPEDWTVENKLDNAYKFFHGRYYSNSYDQINKELVSKVPSKDREPNMKFAADWLQQLTAAGKPNIFQQHLVEALKQFVALNETLDRCDRQAYAILFKNDKATRGRGHVSPTQSAELRRVDRMVYLYSLDHAIACLPRYSSIFRDIYSRRDFKAAELFQDNAIAQHRPQLVGAKFFGLGGPQVDDNALSILLKIDAKLIASFRTAGVAMDTIRQLAAATNEGQRELQFLSKVLDERRGKLVVEKEKVRELVQKYLVKPCEFFIRELGANVLQPARYDIFMVEPEDLDHPNGPEGLHDLDFKLGQARYRFCKLLVRNRDALVNSIARRIAKVD